MGTDIPKQYLHIGGEPVILHTLERLSSVSGLSGIMIGINRTDERWNKIDDAIRDSNWYKGVYYGGVSRAETVLNGLYALKRLAKDDDWVMVHDAARPCVRVSDMDKLVQSVKYHSAGGLLALPMADTVKRADNKNNVDETVDRENLWRALTPQIARYRVLKNALESAIKSKVEITDEASALEHMGLKPQLIEGHTDNIKITRSSDLLLAEEILKAQQTDENYTNRSRL